MSYRVLLAIADTDLAASTRALVDESDDLDVAASTSTFDAIFAACTQYDADAVLLHHDVGRAPATDLTRKLVDRYPHVGVVLIVRESTPDVLRAALQAGARGVVTLPIALEDVHDELVAAARWSRSVSTRGAGGGRDAHISTIDADDAATGTLVTVAGAKGGVGTTTLACQLGATLVADESAPSVCLVDLDLQTGDVSTYLDISHHRHMLDLTDVADELTLRNLEETLYVHTSGLHVLLGPDEGEYAEDVGAGPARLILQGLRATFDVVVVDAGSVLTEGGAMAVELADICLLVVTPDVAAVRGANRALDMWARLNVRDAAGTVCVVNRVSRGTEIQPELIGRIVRAPRTETVLPADFPGLEGAANSGALARPAGGIGAAVRDLCVELGLVDARRRTFLRRDAGQASAELVGTIGMILVIMFALWQFVLVGYTLVLSSHAAREASRDLAVHTKTEEIETRTLDDVPRAWRRGAVVDVDRRAAEVNVALNVPVIVPGWHTPVTVSSTAGTVMEKT